VVPNESTNNATEALQQHAGLGGNEIRALSQLHDLNRTRTTSGTPRATRHPGLQPGHGNGGATGIGDVAVRQAVSLGIDRRLSSIGESGYEAAATSAGGLNPHS